MTCILSLPHASLLRHGVLLALIASCAAPSTGGTGGAPSAPSAPELALESAKIDDRLQPCDPGGARHGACSTLTVTLRNTGAGMLGAASATIGSPSSELWYPRGTTLSFAAMAPGATATASLPFAYPVTLAGDRPLALRIDYGDPQLPGGRSTALVGFRTPAATLASPVAIQRVAPAPDEGLIPSSADLAITVSDGTTTASPGGTVTYTITAVNAGGDDVIGATVSDTFPSDLTCTWTCTGGFGGACSTSGSGNIADAVTLPVGGFTTYTASCAVSPTTTNTTLVNTVTVSPPGSVSDPVPGNNSSTDVDSLATLPALVTGEKTVSGNFTEGGTVTYTIILRNIGSGAQGDNPGNELTDVLPADLALISASATAGTAISTIGTNTVTWNGSIAAGDSVTITIVATITASAGTAVSNQATFVYDGDGNGTNESAGVTDAFPCQD